MSRFDLEKAKAGAPVVTISTNVPVKFICWDRLVGDYVYVVYLELTGYTDRIVSHPISYLYRYLKMVD